MPELPEVIWTFTAILTAGADVLHIVEKDNGQYDTPADILWATGCLSFHPYSYL